MEEPAPDGKDWHRCVLELTTVLDGSYRNTQNVRRFFKAQLGDDFHFSRSFMHWLKTNQGKTLDDAVTAWRAQPGLR
jgi:hypothetical protein